MVSAAVMDVVRRELAALEAAERVRVLYAVESGSRAWGFASEDSDYDVRMIYVYRAESYLTIDLDQKQDVIERTLPGDIDLCGWDLRKALHLFAKSNPSLLECLDSPVVYRETSGLADQLRQLARTSYSPAAALHHYLRTAQNNWHAYCRGGAVRLKKYLYVLRPLLACLWIEQDRGMVPVPFRDLLVTIEDEPALLAEIETLLDRKAKLSELGEGPRMPAIDAFAVEQLDRLPTISSRMSKTSTDVKRLNEIFRETLTAAW